MIGDTHFGHKRVIEFEKEKRPFSSIEEHDQALVDNWNSVVTKRDIVWHLGDVLFTKESFELLSRLNGLKKLVLGNHDVFPLTEYQKHFSEIYGAVKYKGFILTHVPIHDSQFYRFRGNIHGHLHSSRLEDDRYINVSAEQIGLTPVPFDKLVDTS
jgi:calcineurin-like phosphoesterase family protein